MFQKYDFLTLSLRYKKLLCTQGIFMQKYAFHVNKLNIQIFIHNTKYDTSKERGWNALTILFEKNSFSVIEFAIMADKAAYKCKIQKHRVFFASFINFFSFLSQILAIIITGNGKVFICNDIT